MDKVLLIDDDRSVRLLVERGLSSDTMQVFAAGNGADGLLLLASEHPHVALIDIIMPQINGIEAFRKIRALDSKIPVIFVTSDHSSETTIEVMRMGAFDYVSKPINLDKLRKLTRCAIESRHLMDQPLAMPILGNSEIGERFIGSSEPMVEVFKSIGRVSGQNVAVLIRGDSGTGKELVARAIVQHSNRSDNPFVSVNCAAIPDQLLESELFGHEKGAFTGAEKNRVGKFEVCDGGTIFLDEIGDMSPLVQGKVLRLIQDQCFQRLGSNKDISTDVRIITATNRNLEQMVVDGEFREDLLYRLNGYTISLPTLRDRQQDIPALLEYFVRRAKREMTKDSIEGIAPATLEMLCNYSWPGNVRQLQSVVRHTLLHATGTVLGPDSLPEFVREPIHSKEARANLPSKLDTVAVSDGPPVDDSGFASHLQAFIEERIQSRSTTLYDDVFVQVEEYLFRRVLEAMDGNQSKTAEMLGITRGKVRDRIRMFNIQVDKVVS